ncbi:MAG: hypothetical protein IPP34_07815 [Bacteroidetes bacterium]|nr:hypothetical protein [Bacteroidota bacterium]
MPILPVINIVFMVTMCALWLSTKKGILWIGTNGGGLNRYNKAENNFTHFTKENGLLTMPFTP